MNIGVALPDWMFAKDKKMAPIMLFCLVFVGILLPLAVASWYMLNSNRYIGANNIMQETLGFYMYSKYNVKESQVCITCQAGQL
jgi:translocation protein SEC63